MENKAGIILILVALAVIFIVIFPNKAKAATTVNQAPHQNVVSSPSGPKAYSIRDFATLYDLNYQTVKNLMKDEYIGVVTRQVPENDIAPVSYEIDSKYLIPQAFVYLK